MLGVKHTLDCTSATILSYAAQRRLLSNLQVSFTADTTKTLAEALALLNSSSFSGNLTSAFAAAGLPAPSVLSVSSAEAAAPSSSSKKMNSGAILAITLVGALVLIVSIIGLVFVLNPVPKVGRAASRFRLR